MARFRKDGYPEMLLVAVAESICRDQGHIRRAADNGVQKSMGRRKKVTVISYKHQLSAHRLKKIGRHDGVHVVFLAPHKLASLSQRSSPVTRREVGCQVRHRNRFLECVRGRGGG